MLRISASGALFMLLCYSVCEVEMARILAVFPTPSISHQVVFHPINKELARRGHEVVVITPDPAFAKGQAPVNLTEIDLHDISYSVVLNQLIKDPNTFKDTQNIMILISEVFDVWLQLDKVKQILREQSDNFDLLIIENNVRSAVALSHIFKVPVIQISSYGATFQSYDIFGAPRHPFLYPSGFRKRFNNLSFWEMITEFFINWQMDMIYFEDIENKRLKEHFGDDFPPLSELYPNIDLLSLNEHPIWSNIRPIPHNIMHIWGIHKKPENELPHDLKSYLDSSQHGVIYFSLGSNVKSYMLPPEKVEIMAKVLSELPYNVLWKWDLDRLPGEPKNIKLAEWFPQPDILRHPNIKLFITQGGLQSSDEGIRAAVPFVGIPYLGDQFYNTEKYEKLKIGKFLRIEDITEETFREAVETVIGDKSYKDSTVSLRAQMYDQPQPALERMMLWIEHVLRHGGAKHLRAAGANVPWAQYFELELIAMVAAVLCTIIVIVFLSLRFLLNHVWTVVRNKEKSS